MNNYPQGSEWRKWDLHVHTPYSIYQKFGADNEETWEAYLQDLESLPAEFAVLGINDYLFIDGYERLLREKNENGRLANIDLLLPVVEFRIEKFAGINFGKLKRINLHVVFSNEVSIETIRSQFLQTLEQSYILEQGGQAWTRAITRESVEELGKNVKSSVPPEELHKYGSDLLEGFNNLNVKEEKIFESLNKDCFRGKYLIAIGKTEWASLPWTDASIATKKTIINSAHIVFTAAETVDHFDQAKAQLKNQGVNDLLLDCSDAHYLSNSTDKDRIGNCNTWIKADPTFDGLSQILYEPDERIKISENNPQLEHDKPFISEVKVDEKTQIFKAEDDVSFEANHKLPLNQNLVAIIGGRGEGKSMLTDYLASSFIGHKHSKEGTFNKDGSVQLTYHKSNQSAADSIVFELTEDQKAVEFLYINQGRLKNLVEKKDREFQLANEIRQLAKLDEPTFDSDLNKKVLQAIDKFHELEVYFDQTDDEGNKVNSIEYLEQQEQAVHNFISNITTSDNKEKLEKYSGNLATRNRLNAKLRELANLESLLTRTIENLNQRINQVNGEETKITPLEHSVFQKQLGEIVSWKAEIEKEVETISSVISAVAEEFKDYKGDLTTLLNDIDKFQKQLAEIRERISEAKTKGKELENLQKLIFETEQDKPSLIDCIETDYENQVTGLIKEWSDFKDVNSKDNLNEAQKAIMTNLLTDLDIEVGIHFDVNAFYDQIYRCIDGGKWRVKNNRKEQKKHFEVLNFKSLIEFMRSENKYREFYGWDSIHSKTLKRVFFDEEVRKKYLKVFPTLKYKNKDLNKISVGQKGTVYLKMVLATEAFSKPIIFDQPEDDLDNEFIMQNLISLFKELKKYRQVIIVTHNANLVVNADAEQVIIASNIDGALSYSSGSLEDPVINAKICKILEGGELAFEKRRRKYQQIQ